MMAGGKKLSKEHGPGKPLHERGLLGPPKPQGKPLIQYQREHAQAISHAFKEAGIKLAEPRMKPYRWGIKTLARQLPKLAHDKDCAPTPVARQKAAYQYHHVLALLKQTLVTSLGPGKTGTIWTLLQGKLGVPEFKKIR